MFDDDLTPINWIGTVGGGMGGLYLGFETLCKLMEDKANPDALLTTAQAIGLIGGTALTGLLGMTVGAILSAYIQNKMEDGILGDAYLAIIGTPVEKMVKAIGNAKGTIKEKASQIAQAINEKAHQIANKFKNKKQEQENDNTLSR